MEHPAERGTAGSPGKISKAALLEVKNLFARRFSDISLSVKSGEILGIGGLEGHGQRDFVRALYGDLPSTQGTVLIDGKVLTRNSIKKHIRAKMCYVTFDRRSEGIIQGHSVKHNISLVELPKKYGFIRQKVENNLAEQKIREFQIKVYEKEQPVESLSGGNQQKVILARFILSDPKILIVDEPTKGIDVGSRMAIYQQIRELANSGIAVIMLTSDMMELLGLSDRIVVFYEGQLINEFSAASVTEEQIMTAFSGEKVSV